MMLKDVVRYRPLLKTSKLAIKLATGPFLVSFTHLILKFQTKSVVSLTCSVFPVLPTSVHCLKNHLNSPLPPSLSLPVISTFSGF